MNEEANEWRIKANFFGKALIGVLEGAEVVTAKDLADLTKYTEDTCELILEARDDAIKTLGNYLTQTSEPK